MEAKQRQRHLSLDKKAATDELENECKATTELTLFGRPAYDAQ